MTSRKSNTAAAMAMPVARFLGAFSIALGLAELLAPRKLAQVSGLSPSTGTLRQFGMRELAAGVGILTSKDPSTWLWSRVAGDAVDLATLVSDLGPHNDQRGRAGIATGAVALITLLDIWCASAFGSPVKRNASVAVASALAKPVAAKRARRRAAEPPAASRGRKSARSRSAAPAVHAR